MLFERISETLRKIGPFTGLLGALSIFGCTEYRDGMMNLPTTLEAKGQTGDKGPPGDKGVTGDKGPSGTKGLSGDKGVTGDKGSPGDKGLPGDKGVTGDQGLRGDKGLPGDKAMTGDPGPTGEKGLLGDKGPPGDKGPSGEAGRGFTLFGSAIDGSIFGSIFEGSLVGTLFSSEGASLLGLGIHVGSDSGPSQRVASVPTGQIFVTEDAGRKILNSLSGVNSKIDSMEAIERSRQALQEMLAENEVTCIPLREVDLGEGKTPRLMRIVDCKSANGNFSDRLIRGGNADPKRIGALQAEYRDAQSSRPTGNGLSSALFFSVLTALLSGVAFAAAALVTLGLAIKYYYRSGCWCMTVDGVRYFTRLLRRGTTSRRF